jgi:hypothetical protein
LWIIDKTHNPMKKTLLSVVILTIISISCESDHTNATEIPIGVYSGTFQRQLSGGGGEIANVIITFSENTWTGQSDRSKYPALCHGTFSQDKSKIIFTDKCAWTAEFDWSLILAGTYDFTLDGKQLVITKGYSVKSTETFTDKYILTKQE